MKKHILILSFIVLFVFGFGINQVSAVHVNGYYRSNGTYVNSYERTAPDGNPYNNYSYPGNYNPNTGTITGGNASTYLNNYYSGSSGSTYSPSSYSYPTTPTCPLNSYYDGISSCKCNYGYVVSGSSCVSGNSVCYSELGYGSSYDTLSKTCKCNSGYVIGASGQCISESSYCSNQLGLMSRYNSLLKKCECMSGYEYDGSSCVYKTTNYSGYSGYSKDSYDCPLNSHTSITDPTKCSCDTGYQVNATKDACMLIPVVTKTNSQVCQDSFGINVDWDGTKTNDGQLNCNCKTGYVWNDKETSCINAPKVSVKTNDELCSDTYGINSKWNGTENSNGTINCDCDAGYQLIGNPSYCTLIPVKTNEQICQDNLGQYGQYNNLKKECSCNRGYVLKNNKCEKVIISSVIKKISTSTNYVLIDKSFSSTTDNKKIDNITSTTTDVPTSTKTVQKKTSWFTRFVGWFK